MSVCVCTGKYLCIAQYHIKKSQREQVKLSFFNTEQSVKDFFKLNCMTRKVHGLPPQPYCFFKNIYKYIISNGNGFIVLASNKKKIIAGAVYFHAGENVYYKYGASNKKYQHLRANNLVMWEAIKYYSHHGYKILSFGRTHASNEGLIRFKSSWGATMREIGYYTFELNEKYNVHKNNRFDHNIDFARYVPIPILRVIGKVAYKHFG